MDDVIAVLFNYQLIRLVVAALCADPVGITLPSGHGHNKSVR